MSHPISILIACLNDAEQCNRTIRSIRDTAGDATEIIVVDDCSDELLSLEDSGTKLIRNERRAGVGASRHIAALNASSDYLLITDSHMTFEPGWLDVVMKRITGRMTTMHCGRCVQLSKEQPDMGVALGNRQFYQGATMQFAGENNEVLDAKWLPDQPGDDYQIPAIMGACYLCPTDFFFHVNGLRALRSYGGDEELLSLKWWLAGGDIRVMKSVRIGHQFRTESHYSTEQWQIVYNKLATIHTVIPEPHRSRLDFLLGDQPHVRHARNQLKADAHSILSERAYLESILKRQFSWFLSFFKLQCP